MKTTVLFAALTASTLAAAAPADDVIDGYLAIQTALAGDTFEGVPAAATKVQKASEQLQTKDGAIYGKLATDAKAFAAAKDLKEARTAFKDVSATVVDLSMKGKLGERTLPAFYCPMAKGRWLQEGEGLRNPYYGKSMLKCGTRIAATAKP